MRIRNNWQEDSPGAPNHNVHCLHTPQVSWSSKPRGDCDKLGRRKGEEEGTDEKDGRHRGKIGVLHVKKMIKIICNLHSTVNLLNFAVRKFRWLLIIANLEIFRAIKFRVLVFQNPFLTKVLVTS